MTALSGETIGRLCQTNELIQPFDVELVRGAKYDLRVGAKALIAVPGRIDTECLDVVGAITLEPYSKALIYTHEDVKVPNDLRGELSIRSSFHKRGVVSVTGPVDPGYYGKLFIHVINTGDAPVEIPYLSKIASIAFFQLDQPTQILYDDGAYQSDVDPEELRPYPKKRVGDLTDVAATVEELRSTAQELRASSKSTEALMNNLVLAAVAGVAAGAIYSVVASIHSDYGMLPAVLAVAGGVLGVALYNRYLRGEGCDKE